MDLYQRVIADYPASTVISLASFPEAHIKREPAQLREDSARPGRDASLAEQRRQNVHRVFG